MSRRRAWFRLAAIAASRAEPVPSTVYVTDDAELAALLEKSNSLNRELGLRVEKLQQSWDAEIRRVDGLEAELAEANGRIEQQDLSIAALARRLAAAEHHVAEQL